MSNSNNPNNPNNPPQKAPPVDPTNDPQKKQADEQSQEQKDTMSTPLRSVPRITRGGRVVLDAELGGRQPTKAVMGNLAVVVG